MQKLHVLTLPALTESPHFLPHSPSYSYASASALPCRHAAPSIGTHSQHTAQYAKQSTRRLSWRCCCRRRRRRRHHRHCLMQQLLRRKRWRRSRVPDSSATS